MSWERLGISILLVAALVAAYYFDRYRYTQKMLRRLRKQGLRAEAIRPRPRSWYRFRAMLTLLAAAIVSYPLAQWIFPDGRYAVRTSDEAIILGGSFLFGVVVYGWWLGNLQFDIADAAYREAKARENARNKT